MYQTFVLIEKDDHSIELIESEQLLSYEDPMRDLIEQTAWDPDEDGAEGAILCVGLFTALNGWRIQTSDGCPPVDMVLDY